MRLSKAVAISILTSLGVQGLIIPSVGEIIDVFGVTNYEKTIDNKLESLKNAAHDAAEHMGLHLSKETLAPIVNIDSTRDIIPNKYIIVFKKGTAQKEAAWHQEWVAVTHSESIAELKKQNKETQNEFFATIDGVNVEGGISDMFNIDNVLVGYTGYFLDSTIELIRKNPLVDFIEKDSMVYANEFDVEKGAPWGLARVSHRQPLSLSSFDQYLYDSEGGDGVTAYVIDTGVNIKHEQFQGRAKWGKTIPSGDEDLDGNGHGSHCSGTIGSKDYGVAKKVEIVAVKVLRSNGSGTMSDVVKGVEFAAKSHQDAAKAGKKGFKGSTANMSLGGGKSPALDLAVNAAVKAGLHFAVAAGNENQDACNTSPASAENAITVGASTISDARAYFSNYGKCVDIFAPGLNILSTYIGSDTATAYLSGTSMASPHICGLLSYYLSLQPGAESEFFVAADGVTPAQLKKNLISYGTEGVLADIPDDTPNILAFNGAGHNLTEFWHEK
ncbi:SUB8 [Candida jiufengensis]|uniref:SUB8 n=1 Tax=Candida jiufengensis TaxID=497108 RepID=UPI0022250ABE|nr:SUB8 [Candida jiufengensis]KAI5949338.1 SUB8 [Candida jiufengensis]